MVEMTAFTNHRARGERGTDGRPFLLRPVRAGKQKPDPRDPIGDKGEATLIVRRHRARDADSYQRPSTPPSTSRHVPVT